MPVPPGCGWKRRTPEQHCNPLGTSGAMEGARAALGGGVGRLRFEDLSARIWRGLAMHLASQSSSQFLAPSC